MEHFLVSYEYGSGTVWGYVEADGTHEVEAFLPEVDVWDDPPSSLSVEHLAEIASQPPVRVDTRNAIDALLFNRRAMNAAVA